MFCNIKEGFIVAFVKSSCQNVILVIELPQVAIFEYGYGKERKECNREGLVKIKML